MGDNGSSSGRDNAMRWSVEDSRDFVVVRTEGSFNAEDHRAMVADITSRPFWKPSRDAFFDHRALAFDGVGYEVMKNAVDNHVEFDAAIGKGRTAVLMRSAADYGLGRIFDGVADQRINARVRMFMDENAARLWLAGKEDGED